MSAISTDGMDKWLDDAYPDLDRRKANMIYEIASLIKDDPDTAPVLIEELVEIMFDEQIDHLEDCLLYTSPSPRDRSLSRMPSSA